MRHANTALGLAGFVVMTESGFAQHKALRDLVFAQSNVLAPNFRSMLDETIFNVGLADRCVLIHALNYQYSTTSGHGPTVLA